MSGVGGRTKEGRGVVQSYAVEFYNLRMCFMSLAHYPHYCAIMTHFHGNSSPPGLAVNRTETTVEAWRIDSCRQMSSPDAAREVHGDILAVKFLQVVFRTCGDLGVAEVGVGRGERITGPSVVEDKILMDWVMS